jgi:hypothetical protein
MITMMRMTVGRKSLFANLESSPPRHARTPPCAARCAACTHPHHINNNKRSTRSLLTAFKGRDNNNVSLTTSVALDLEALEYYYTSTANTTQLAQPMWQELTPGGVRAVLCCGVERERGTLVLHWYSTLINDHAEHHVGITHTYHAASGRAPESERERARAR